MRPHAGLLWSSVALLVAGVLFYLVSVSVGFFHKVTPPDDIGLYSVTVALVGMGAAGLLLWWAKTHPSQNV